MSMINDALRRASSAAKTTPGEAPGFTPVMMPPPPLPPMPVAPAAPAAPPPPPIPATVADFPPPPSIGELGGEQLEPPALGVERPKQKSALSLVLLVLVFLCAAGAGGFYFWNKNKKAVLTPQQALNAKLDLSQAGASATPLAGESPHAKASASPERTKPVPATAPAVPRVNQPIAKAPAAAAVPAPPPIAVPVAPVVFPPLRLQSIFYRPSNPSVIINGKTLFIDDEINGVKVTDIRASTVILVLSGQTNVLTLR